MQAQQDSFALSRLGLLLHTDWVTFTRSITVHVHGSAGANIHTQPCGCVSRPSSGRSARCEALQRFLFLLHAHERVANRLIEGHLHCVRDNKHEACSLTGCLEPHTAALVSPWDQFFAPALAPGRDGARHDKGGKYMDLWRLYFNSDIGIALLRQITGLQAKACLEPLQAGELLLHVHQLLVHPGQLRHNLRRFRGRAALVLNYLQPWQSQPRHALDAITRFSGVGWHNAPAALSRGSVAAVTLLGFQHMGLCHSRATDSAQWKRSPKTLSPHFMQRLLGGRQALPQRGQLLVRDAVEEVGELGGPRVGVVHQRCLQRSALRHEVPAEQRR